MALKEVKQRIKSVKSISQITKAMEVVAATKMRRSQEVALSGRPFALAALEMLYGISFYYAGKKKPKIIRERKSGGKAVLVVVTSDRGMAGAFNANV